MKTTCTLIALLGLSFCLLSQTPTGNDPVSPPNHTQHRDSDSLISPMVIVPRSTENATIELESYISWFQDTTLNAWFESDRTTFTYYDNGSVKTAENRSFQYLNKTHYNESSLITKFEVYEMKQGTWEKVNYSQNTYDSENKILDRVRYATYNNSLVKEYEENHLYDQDGNEITYITAYLTPNHGTWSKNKTESRFTSGLCDIRTYYQMHQSTWQIQSRAEYNYDAHGNNIYTLFSSYDGNTWTESNTWQSSYNAAHKIILTTNKYKSDTTCLNSYKETWQYDSNGNVINKTDYRGDSLQWDIQQYTKSNFDANNNRIKYEYRYGFDSISTNWNISVLSYNLNNQLLESVSTKWDNMNGIWVNYRKLINTYDAYDNLKNWTRFIGDSLSWIPTVKQEYTLNTEMPLEEVKMPQLYVPEHMYHQILHNKRYVWQNTQWELSDSTNYYYSLISNIKEKLEVSLNLYPNPATDFLHIEGDITANATLRILDANGRLVQTNFKSNQYSKRTKFKTRIIFYSNPIGY